MVFRCRLHRYKSCIRQVSREGRGALVPRPAATSADVPGPIAITPAGRAAPIKPCDAHQARVGQLWRQRKLILVSRLCHHFCNRSRTVPKGNKLKTLAQYAPTRKQNELGTGMKGFWNNASVAGLIAALTSWLLGKADSLKVELSWSWIPNWVVMFGRWLRTPLLDPVQVIWIIMGALIIRSIYLKMKSASVTESKSGEPSPQEYTEGTFGGVFWRWRQNSGPSSLHAYCNACDFELDEENNVVRNSNYPYQDGYIECGHCRSKAPVLLESSWDRRERAARQIDHAWRNGSWKSIVIAARERTSRIRQEQSS